MSEVTGSHSLLHDVSGDKFAFDRAYTPSRTAGPASLESFAHTSTMRCGPLEITDIGIVPHEYAVIARLVNPTARTLVVIRVPTRVHADAPLEMEVADVGMGPGLPASPASVTRWLSAHAEISLVVGMKGQADASYSVPVAVRPFGGGWIASALIRPATWANAASVTVVSLSLAGRPLPCDCLPATLRVGYNHAPAPAGAVFCAAKAGDVAELHAALDAGGSTEEADEVRGDGIGSRKIRRTQQKTNCTPPPPLLRQYGNTSSIWAAAKDHLEALRTLLAAGANPATSEEVRDEEVTKGE